MFYGFVITEAGNSLLASMVAGQTLTITKAVMGEGTADNAEAARQLTNLITRAGGHQHHADGGRERRQHDRGVSVRPERRPAGRVLDR